MSSLTTPYSKGGMEERRSVAAELEGGLLLSTETFSYYMLIALEAGGPLRALLLLLFSPIIYLLNFSSLHDTSLQIMIFVSTAGLKVADVKAVAKATLPRFYLADLSETAYKAFSNCKGDRYVVTKIPKIMVEPFLREYLDVNRVVATEIMMLGDYCSGVIAGPGFMAIKEEIDVGLATGHVNNPFILQCGKIHIVGDGEKQRTMQRRDYPRPLIFHDGRLVLRPTPLNAAAMLLYLPLGVVLATVRILVGVVPPYRWCLPGSALTGLRIRAQFAPSVQSVKPSGRGTLYVCAHRTLLDPVFVSTVLQKRVPAVTYSLSRFSEIISPIPTVRLRRDRDRDGEAMQRLLDGGDLVVCPEGTTCREPYLLRFSPLFAEMAGDIVPVAVRAEGSMFYGTTVRGYKWLDCPFFLMNPMPCYRLEFLDRVEGCGGGGRGGGWSSYEVANKIQRSIGRVLGFECTNLTRKDKYRMIAGNDGLDTRDARL